MSNIVIYDKETLEIYAIIPCIFNEQEETVIMKKNIDYVIKTDEELTLFEDDNCIRIDLDL